jgi:ribonuclease G
VKNYSVISDSPGELRALSFKGAKAIDFLVRRFERKIPMRHDVFLAKVEQWSPSLDGVFLCLGEGGKAFMPTPKGIILKPGGLYPVTVVRSAIGEKLTRVSMDIVFASPRLLLIPQKKGLHLSNRAKQRAGQMGQLVLHRLKQENLDYLLVRENAFSASPDALLHEAKFLTERFKAFNEEVRLKKTQGVLKYATTYLEWFICDAITQGEIQVGSEQLFHHLRKDWQALCPDLASQIILIDAVRADAIIDEQMENILSPKIPFSNIGNLVFEHTQALTAIDVNAFAGHKKGHRYQLNINLQTVPEIARQIRLRNIGGLIIIDFINMPDDGSRQAIEAEIQKAFADDYAETKIFPISDTGLMQIVREKSGPSVAEIFLAPQEDMFFSFETVMLNLIRVLVRRVGEYPDRRIIVSCHPDFLNWLKHKSYHTDMIPKDISALVSWKSDANTEPRKPFMNVAGVSEPFFV